MEKETVGARRAENGAHAPSGPPAVDLGGATAVATATGKEMEAVAASGREMVAVDLGGATAVATATGREMEAVAASGREMVAVPQAGLEALMVAVVSLEALGGADKVVAAMELVEVEE